MFHPICGFLKMNVFFLNGYMSAFRKECSVVNWGTGRGGLEAEWRQLSLCLPCASNHCCSVTQSCPTLCDPMDCSMPGFPVLHHLPEFAHSCLLNRWCHPTISSSVIPLSSCLQSFSASGSFLMSQLFASGGQSIRASASASVLPMNIQGWFPLGLTGLIFLLSKGFSRVFSSTTIQKHQYFGAQLSL